MIRSEDLDAFPRTAWTLAGSGVDGKVQGMEFNVKKCQEG